VKKNQIILIIIGLLILTEIIFGFNYWQKQIKLETKVTEETEPVLEEEPSLVNFPEEEKLIKDFIEANLEEAYYPESISLIKSNPIEKETIYGFGWRENDINLRAELIKNSQKELIIQIFLDNPAELNEKAASEIFDRFFKINGSWECKNENNRKFCTTLIDNGRALIIFSVEGTTKTSVTYRKEI